VVEPTVTVVSERVGSETTTTKMCLGKFRQVTVWPGGFRRGFHGHGQDGQGSEGHRHGWSISERQGSVPLVWTGMAGLGPADLGWARHVVARFLRVRPGRLRSVRYGQSPARLGEVLIGSARFSRVGSGQVGFGYQRLGQARQGSHRKVLARPYWDWLGMACLPTARRGAVRRDAAGFGGARSGMSTNGSAWTGLGAARFGMATSGPVSKGRARCGTAWHGAATRGSARMASVGLVVVRKGYHGMVSVRLGVDWLGMSGRGSARFP
jgi:hypothetical protein